MKKGVRVSKQGIIRSALEAGIMISTMHGQEAQKLMPVSDVETLIKFYTLARENGTEYDVSQ